MVTHNPLYGSGQAGLPHPALASGDNAHAPQGIRMTSAAGGNQRSIRRRIRSQSTRDFWLRRKSVRCQSRPTWNRNVHSTVRSVGTP